MIDHISDDRGATILVSVAHVLCWYCLVKLSLLLVAIADVLSFHGDR